MKRHRSRFIAIGILIVSLLASSCIDKDFDLNNIDKTLSANVDLTLPTSSTGHILLRNIVNMKEDGALTTMPWGDKGEDIWVISQKGSAEMDPIEVDEVEITGVEVGDFDVMIDRRDLQPTENSPRKSLARRSKVNIDGVEVELNNKVYYYDIPADKAKKSIEDNRSTDIPDDLVALERIDIQPAVITLQANVKDYPGFASKVHLDNLQLNLPYDLHVTNCQIDGEPAVSIEPGHIVLTPTNDTHIYDLRNIKISCTVDYVTTTHEFKFDTENHSITLEGDFSVTGAFILDTSDMPTDLLEEAISKLSGEEKKTLAQTGDLESVSLIPRQMNFIGDTEFEPTIHVTHITGDVRHNVGTINPIKINNIPDVLNNEDAVIDLDNPMVFITATNEIDATAHTTLTLTSNTDSTEHSTGDISIEGGGKENVFCLSSRMDPTYLTSEKYKTAQHIYMPDLGNLIKKVPDEIGVQVTPVTMHCDRLAVGRSYHVNVDYELFAPLTFGEKFTLAYSKTDNGWNLHELEKMDLDSIIVIAKATSTLPLAVDFTLEPLDSTYNIIDQLSINKVELSPNSKNENIRIVIKGINGTRIGDALRGSNGVQKLNGIRYKAYAHDPLKEGGALKSDAHIQLDDIKVTAKGMLTYDAN